LNHTWYFRGPTFSAIWPEILSKQPRVSAFTPDSLSFFGR
jgi:hypothetical protein